MKLIGEVINHQFGGNAWFDVEFDKSEVEVWGIARLYGKGKQRLLVAKVVGVDNPVWVKFSWNEKYKPELIALRNRISKQVGPVPYPKNSLISVKWNQTKGE